MDEIILFGGTTEGRLLCELLAKKQRPALVCVATEYGEALLSPSPVLRIHAGRLDRAAMEALFLAEKPRLVIDATHPYAAAVGENIRAACRNTGTKRIRLLRERSESDGCELFPHLDALLPWLRERTGTIFSSLGAKEAAALTAIADYRDRVWLRILPDVAGLSACLEAGFPAGHIICMQGPFSQALNVAMFRAAGAKILLTKESGAAGGTREKIQAARECGMTVAVLARPPAEDGMTLAALSKLIEEGVL